MRLHGGNGVLAECSKGGRKPPLLPEQFTEELARKAFHDPTSDRPLVAGLYAQVFAEQLGAATELDYHSMGWGDAEALQLAKVLGSGAVPHLRLLDISFNPIGDRGGVALAKALSSAAPELETIKIKGIHAEEGTKRELRVLVAGRAMLASRARADGRAEAREAAARVLKKRARSPTKEMSGKSHSSSVDEDSNPWSQQGSSLGEMSTATGGAERPSSSMYGRQGDGRQESSLEEVRGPAILLGS